MRILYFTRDYTTHDHRFLSALAQTEYKLFYLRLEQRGHPLEERPLPPRVEIVPWVGGRSPAHFWNAPRLLLDLRRVIRHVQPDLIQAGPLHSTALLAALTGFHPIISMSWGYDLLVDAHRNALWRFLTRFVLRRSTIMVGDCDTIRQLAIQFGMPDNRIVTFPWGVDIHHFNSHNREETSRDTFTLISTRGWESIYGIHILAQAFVQSAHKYPHLRLVLLGDGTKEKYLCKTFAHGGVLEQVTFQRQVSQDDLPRYYRLADLYISASRSDGTSISLLEAMACGCPVLVSDIPGNREWVTPGVNGWLFRDGDPHALALGISSAIARRARLSQMGRAARQIAEQRADWSKNFMELLKAYNLALL